MLSAPYSIKPYHQGQADYYHRQIKVIFIPSWAQTPQLPAVEGTARFWQEPYPEDGFPRGARHYYHFFVHPTPRPIPSPLPPHAEPHTIEGWMVDRDGFISIELMGPNEITLEIKRQTGWDSVPLKVVQVSYWRDEDQWAAADPMPSLPNIVWAAGDQYPPGAEVYMTLTGSSHYTYLLSLEKSLCSQNPPCTPTPNHSPPCTPETPPRTAEAGYSLRDSRGMGGPEPGPSYCQGTQYCGSSYRPEEECWEHPCSKGMAPLVHPIGQCMEPSLPQALTGTPPMDQGRIKLPGPNPTSYCPLVGIEIAQEALPAAGALMMKVKKGVQIPGPQNDNNWTSPSSKWVEGSMNHFPSGRSCPHTHKSQSVNLVPSQTHDPMYMNASPEYLETIMGPGSPLGTSYLKGFQYLKRLDTLGAITQSPFKDEMNVLEAYKTLRPALQRGHLKFEEWCSEVDRLEGKRYLSLALVHLATHMALDTIAYLSGLKSPVFSLDEMLIGAIFGPSLEPQAPDPGMPDNGMQWNAVLMERLGMPCWGIMPRVVPQQLDFDAGGQPDVDPLKEADFQKGMQAISCDQQPLQAVIYSQNGHACLLPLLQQAPKSLVMALDSEMPDAYTIEETSEKLKGLLGSKVWSSQWDVPLHLGAHNSISDSLIEVPLGYFHPELRFPLHMGHAPNIMASTISPNKPSTLQGVEPNLCLVLVKEQGIRQKDSQKVLEINFLFKHPNQQDAVLQSLRESDPKVDAHAVDTDPQTWRSDYQHFFDEGYIRQLFTDPWPIKDIVALLELAPPSSHPINTREAAKTVAVDMERARQALLLQMFEVERYPPWLSRLNQFFVERPLRQWNPGNPSIKVPTNQGTRDESAALEVDAKQVEAMIAQVVEQSKNKGSTQGSGFDIQPKKANCQFPYSVLPPKLLLIPKGADSRTEWERNSILESTVLEAEGYQKAWGLLTFFFLELCIILPSIGPPSCFSWTFGLQSIRNHLQHPSAFPMAKKLCHAKPLGHASDSTVRPTSNSTVRPASDPAATHRSNRWKLKEEALQVEPTKAKAKPLYKKKPPKQGLSDEGGWGSEGMESGPVPGSPQTLGAKYRVKTYQKCTAGPQDVSKEPEKADNPLQAPKKLQMGRKASSDPASVPKGDSEAAEVAKGLEGLGDEGEDFSGFPADQFEEPPDSEEEQRRLLGLHTASETQAFGPNAWHKAYSKDPGEASKDTEAPSSSESDGVVPSFADSTTDGEYISGLEEVMNNERNLRDLARLEAERAKGKGKEAEVEVDDEAEEKELGVAHMKPLVSRLTKSQMEHVKHQAEEEREWYAALAQEMQVPAELVLQTAHAQTGKSHGGPWNDFTWLYSAENPDHGEPFELEIFWLLGLLPTASKEIQARVNRKMFSGSSRASVLKKLGKDLSEKGFIEEGNSQSRQSYNLYDLAAVGFVTVLDLMDGAAIANASVFAPSKKIGDIVEQIFWTPANKWKFMYSLGWGPPY
ncbi:hypothetical protein BS47DRAFT_1369720 [Hydnum rufescens UP504]|uniref:Uncharacterized protein n=1 Tax=Hydnum rufescens UP504 TaxID=1448309 RepID=A0A9P6DG51_9AGAM|nr:hypothetical protein BS47DRAFT_1369720 [Hydnum rufescens UP504]